jgi:hypothetical protein
MSYARLKTDGTTAVESRRLLAGSIGCPTHSVGDVGAVLAVVIKIYVSDEQRPTQ